MEATLPASNSFHAMKKDQAAGVASFAKLRGMLGGVGMRGSYFFS
jgi:hypothetical protein